MGDTAVKICSLNCQGLGDYNKRRDVFKYLHTLNYSIICLQDTHFSKTKERIIENEWGYKAFFNSFNSQSRGVAILLNNNFEFKIHSSLNDETGNFLIIDLETNNKRFVLTNIYGPNQDDPAFYKNIL